MSLMRTCKTLYTDTFTVYIDFFYNDMQSIQLRVEKTYKNSVFSDDMPHHIFGRIEGLPSRLTCMDASCEVRAYRGAFQINIDKLHYLYNITKTKSSQKFEYLPTAQFHNIYTESLCLAMKSSEMVEYMTNFETIRIQAIEASELMSG